MDSNVAFLAADIGRLFRKRFEMSTRDIGVTGDQGRVLARITDHPGIHQGALAALLEVEAITAGRMVDRLEKLGLVERRPDEHDRRVWLLHPTPRAAHLLEIIRGRLGRVVDEATEEFSPDEIEHFVGLLTRLRSRLLELGSEPVEVVSNG